MPKLEENDLLIFIQSLRTKEYKSFRKQLKLSNKKDSIIKLKLFETLIKGNSFDKNKFLKKYALIDTKYSIFKFELFQQLVNHLKVNYDQYSDLALQNKQIEYDLLLKVGLHIKANRKLKEIKKNAFEKCDFITCFVVQQKAIKYRLFTHTSSLGNLKEASNELRKYQELSNNLNAYMLLSDEVLNSHYEFMDKRAQNRSDILEYLNHPLLHNKESASSVMAMYYFYRIKSLIYLGDNDYKNSMEYSLKAFYYLKENYSKYRNDYLHYVTCLNNYLDASLHLLETKYFEEMYPQMIKITNSSITNNDIYSKAIIFETLSTLRLNYLWLVKDCVTFYDESEELEKSYYKYESILRPNFKIEIILSLAKMYFLAGDLEKANHFCKKIEEERNNPTIVLISCGNLLRLMINFDLGNHQLIPHLISTSKYSLKKRSRLFDLEKCFLNGLHKIKFYYSPEVKSKLFFELHEEIKKLLENSEEIIIDKKIRILDWLSAKSKVK
jgi:hypothetical protein